ncbi:cyclase family protein [Actinoplanes sp. NBRC 103695]|uniref:cyclase family protein n=1 Tax=Actinoplanes sp. NBRC 103695 TaxID=3032202 RepID=UPI002556FD32|nr:cyclase family protein [Actinoplanes sp. NBRC 103695]
MFDDLADASPPYSSWSFFGADDRRGTINLLTPARVAAAAKLIRTGEQLGLDYAVNAFEPYPTGTRPPTQHHVFANNEFHRDDWLDSFYLQSTSQLDSLRHIGHPAHGFYNGQSPDSSELGIHRWADTGIAGRGVLLDVAGYFAAAGRGPLSAAGGRRPLSAAGGPEPLPAAGGPEPLPAAGGRELDAPFSAAAGSDYDCETTVTLEAALLDEIAAHQGVTFDGGDLLLLHTGWAANYVAKTPEERVEFNTRNRSPGLAQRTSTLRWLWDHEIALVASDTPAVEADPVGESDFRGPADRPPDRGVDHSGMLHRPLIALLGMAMGELWKLDELAARCAATGRYDFFLTCKPLNIPGGVGSPPNAIAFM